MSTSRHVTQGMIDVRDERWDAATGTLSGTSQVVAGDPYELRIAGLADVKLWQPASAGVSAADQAAGVTVTQADGSGLTRVTLRSAVSRDVKWSVKFTAQPLPAGGTEAVTGLKAAMENADAPVVLSWNGSATSYEIRRDGTVIAAEYYDLTYADAEAPAGKTCTYTVKPLDGGTAATVALATKASDRPEVSLMKLTALSATTGWSDVGIGKAASGGPLTLSGKIYPNGLGLHAKAELVYACQPEWKRFVATVGIDDAVRHREIGSIVCHVIAEDAAGKKQTLAKSPVLKSGQQMEYHFDVRLPAGAAKLHLVVDDAGDGANCDHADWVNAGFRKE